jgi:hypothetical protein
MISLPAASKNIFCTFISWPCLCGFAVTKIWVHTHHIQLYNYSSWSK